MSEWTGHLGAPAQQTALLWSGGNLFVSATGLGLPQLPFLLDSGAGGNGVCAEAVDRHGVIADGGTEVRSGTAAGSHQVRTGLQGTFAVGEDAPRDSALFVAPCPRGDEVGVEKAGYVGAPWFRARRVFFPVDRRLLAFGPVQ